MAKKSEPQGKSPPDAEVSGSPNDRREGLSKEAWITIGTIAAALITGCSHIACSLIAIRRSQWDGGLRFKL